MNNKSAFLKLLENKTELRVLDCLLDNHNREFTMNEIIEISGVNRNIGYKFLKILIKKKMLLKSKKVKNFVFYKLNLKHPLVKAMMRLDLESAKYYHKEG